MPSNTLRLKHPAVAALSFFFLGVVAACSSSTNTTPSGAAACNGRCDVTINGENKVLACGESACFGGRITQKCTAAGAVEEGDACTKPPAGTDAGKDPIPAGGPFPCKDVFGETTMCDSATEYCVVFKKTQSTGGVTGTRQCVKKPASCNDCDCVSDDAPESFTATGGGCKSATLLCDASNGKITLTCMK